MKNVILFVFALVANLSFSQYDNENVRGLDPFYEFEEGSSEILYGDNVILRKKPATNAKAIDTLSIGSKVKIIENSKEPVTVNGKESFWYKVKTNKGTGYIAGGLIALDSREINGGIYMVILAGANDRFKFRVRYLKDGEFYGKEGDLITYSFALRVHDNRGVKGIESMLVLDFFANACGVDGGYTYLFNDGEKLINAIHCADVGDSGYWFTEKLTFPDERGWGDHIDYEREVGEPMNEDYTWFQSKKDMVTLEWKEGRFEPNVSEMNFSEGDSW